MTKWNMIVLRIAVIMAGLMALVMGIVLLPRLVQLELAGDFDFAPLLIAAYLVIIPFLYALYYIWKLLQYADRNVAVSDKAVHALMVIKRCAYIATGAFAVILPYVFYLADQDDSPGLFAMGLMMTGGSLGAAAVAATLQGVAEGLLKKK